MDYSNFNDFVDYSNDVVLPESETKAIMDNLHWLPEIAGEVFMDVLPGTSVGIGFGVISGKSEISVAAGEEEFTLYEHHVKAYPISATGFFEPHVPFVMAKPFLFAGFDIYYSTLYFKYPIELEGYLYELEADLDTWGFGFHGGAGLEFQLMPTVSIELSVSGRWADIKGYEGKAKIPGRDEIDVFLIAGKWANGLVIYGVESLDYKKENNEGSVDLSGIGFSLGFKVAL